MRKRTIYTLENTQYNIENIDGCGAYHVNFGDNWIWLANTLVGAKKFLAKKTNTEYKQMVFDIHTEAVK